MRKLFCLLLTAALLLTASASAELPSLDRALEIANSVLLLSPKLEIRCDEPLLELDRCGSIDYGNLRMVLLERQGPEKAFTAYDSGYPGHYQANLPENFTGTDLGESQTWLRTSLMRLLPEYMRAASAEEADFYVIAETQYVWSGTLVVTSYTGDDDPGDRVFANAAELEAYRREHPKTINAITYYPTFAAFQVLYLYDPATQTCAVYDYQYAWPRRFARNPEAQDIWNDMEDLVRALTLLRGGSLTAEGLTAMLGTCESIPAEKLSFWESCLAGGEQAALAASMESCYWTIAAALAEADPEEEHRATLNNMIAARDANGLALAVELYNYGGFDESIEAIGESKEYMAAPDPAWIERTLKEFVDTMNQ